MPYIIAGIALIWLLWPIVGGIFRIFFVLFSGVFNTFGKFLLVALAILGIWASLMTGPIGWLIGGIVFIIFLAVKR